jgi:hypothetical protein
MVVVIAAVAAVVVSGSINNGEVTSPPQGPFPKSMF